MIYLSDTNLLIKATAISKPWCIYIILILVNAFFFFFFLNVYVFLSSNSFSQWLTSVDYGEFVASYWDAVNKTFIAGDQGSIQCYILTQTWSHTFPFHMLLLSVAEKYSCWENIFIKQNENYYFKSLVLKIIP